MYFSRKIQSTYIGNNNKIISHRSPPCYDVMKGKFFTLQRICASFFHKYSVAINDQSIIFFNTGTMQTIEFTIHNTCIIIPSHTHTMLIINKIEMMRWQSTASRYIIDFKERKYMRGKLLFFFLNWRLV